MDVDDTMSRRVLFGTAGSGAIGIGAVALTGCGPGGDSGDSGDPASRPSSSGGGQVLAELADVPVGGSVAATLDGQPVVLAQPEQGHVVCFSAVCTHQGCTVKAGGKQLHCPCHGSVFQSATGAVAHGPADSPLPAVAVKVVDGSVVTA